MQEGFFKRLLDNASDLIWAIDTEGRFIYINDNIKEWGYDKNDLIGQPLLNILNTRRISKRHSEPALLGFNQTYEMEILDKRRRAHKVVVESSPLQDDNGAIIGVMGIIRDVTQMQLLEEKLKNEERLASLGRLATGIAHEIRNPLSSVKMNLAILHKRLKPSGDDDEHFKIAQEEVVNLERIVTELLDYARPITLNLRRRSLREEIERALATVKAEYEEKNVAIGTNLARGLPLVHIDRMKFHQVLLNVLINAVQASQPGSAVEISTGRHPNPAAGLRVSVKDHGAGIEPEDMKFVFDPFFTTKKNGTGLGLSIVRNIMNTHGGDISIESDPGRGATVHLDLPGG